VLLNKEADRTLSHSLFEMSILMSESDKVPSAIE